MFKKGTKPYSIFKNKCPKCQEGDFYIDKNPFSFGRMLKTYEHCNKCGFKYEIEPSFFYGAMYVSYAITVAVSIATFIILYALGLNFIQIFIGIIISLILFTPLTLRLSRLIYSNMFISYDENYKNEEGLKNTKK